MIQEEEINRTAMLYAVAAVAQPVHVNFYGISQFPNPEQIQVVQPTLSAAVRMA